MLGVSFQFKPCCEGTDLLENFVAKHQGHLKVKKKEHRRYVLGVHFVIYVLNFNLHVIIFTPPAHYMPVKHLLAVVCSKLRQHYWYNIKKKDNVPLWTTYSSKNLCIITSRLDCNSTISKWQNFKIIQVALSDFKRSINLAVHWWTSIYKQCQTKCYNERECWDSDWFSCSVVKFVFISR